MTKQKPKTYLPHVLEKYNSGEQLLRYEKEFLFKKLRTKADTTFNKWIRDRDKGKGCVSYGANRCKNLVEHACHRIEAAWYSHRRDENNVNGGCSTCNGYNVREHIMYYDQWIISKYGKKRAEEQLSKKNKIKPTIDELIAIIDKYEKRIKESIEKSKEISI